MRVPVAAGAGAGGSNTSGTDQRVQAILEYNEAASSVGQNIRKAYLEAKYRGDIEKQLEIIESLGRKYRAIGNTRGDGLAFARAAGLFNFCINLCRNEEGNIRWGYIGRVEHYQRQLQIIEEDYLRSLGIYVAQELPYSATTTSHKKSLKQIRNRSRQELEELRKEVEAVRAEGVKNIYQGIEDGMKQLISKMVHKCEQILGPPPCQYAVVAFGSMARGEMTPYSDFEWGIILEDNLDKVSRGGGAGESKEIDGELVEDETARNIREERERLVRAKEYFTRLTHLMQFKVINLGETILPALAIKELEGWFYDDVTPRGFSMDGLMPHASKWPLGNEHAEGLSEEQRFTLIGTPWKIVSSHINAATFEQNRSLFFVLTNSIFIHGNEQVYDSFVKYRREESLPAAAGAGAGGSNTPGTDQRVQAILERSWDEISEAHKEIALDFLRSDILKFIPKVGKIVEVPDGGGIRRIYPVKFDLYRLPNLLFDSLALYHGMDERTTWSRIEHLRDLGFFNEDRALYISHSFSRIAELRLSRYLALGRQNEDLVTHNTIEEAEILKLFEAHFYLVDVGYYFAFSGVNHFDTLPKQHLARIRVLEKLGKHNEVIEECKKMEGAVTDIRDLLTILNWLGRGYLGNGDYLKARETFKKALDANCRARVPVNPALLCNYAEVLTELGDYNRAIGALNWALNLTYSEGHQSGIADFYEELHLTRYQIVRQLGLTLEKVGRVEEARQRFEVAKKEVDELLKHGKNIDYYNIVLDLARVHSELGNYLEAESLYNDAIKGMTDLFGGRHPNVADVLYDRGQLLYRQKRYEEAINSYEQAIAIYENQGSQTFKKQIALCNNDKALCLVELGGEENFLALARTTIDSALGDIHRVFGPMHRETAIFHINRARVLLGIMFSGLEVAAEPQKRFRMQFRQITIPTDIQIMYRECEVILASYEKATDILVQCHGAEIDLAHARNNLAEFLLRVKKHSKYFRDIPGEERKIINDGELKFALLIIEKGLAIINKVIETRGKSIRTIECKAALLNTKGNIMLANNVNYTPEQLREPFLELASMTVNNPSLSNHLARAFSGLAASQNSTLAGRRASIKYFFTAITILDSKHDRSSIDQRAEAMRNLAKILWEAGLRSASRHYYELSIIDSLRIDVSEIRFYNLVFSTQLGQNDNSQIDLQQLRRDAERIGGNPIGFLHSLGSDEQIAPNQYNLTFNRGEGGEGTGGGANTGNNYTVGRVRAVYDNPVIGTRLLEEAGKRGFAAIDLLFRLGADLDIATQLLEAAEQQGSGAVIDLLLSSGVQSEHHQLPLLEDGVQGETNPEGGAREGGNEGSDNKIVTYHIPSSSNFDDNSVITPLLILGVSMVKFVETKESFRYIFTEIIPTNISFNVNFIIGMDNPEGDSNNQQQQEQEEDNAYQLELYNKERGGLGGFISEQGPWLGLHLIGGLSISFAFNSEQVGLAEKILAPVISSSSYASRYLYHSSVKQQILGEEYANSCMMNILADSAFGAITSLPYSIMTGSPLPMIYGTAQAAAISGVGCLSSSNTNNDESSYISSTAANIVTAGSVVYSYQQGALSLTFTTAREAIFSISKIATTASIASLVHRATKAATDATYNWWYGDYISENNSIEAPQTNLVGESEF